ncbi:hypothetical protein V8G54_011580 [Vigna mungo]|uniref:Uncharacterized protein n=1 Tax=Vigna mungo TaxID=3915 RepID=A0AAQ3S368_VIGMU
MTQYTPPRRFLNLIALTKHPLLPRSEVRIEGNSNDTKKKQTLLLTPAIKITHPRFSLSLTRAHALTPFLTNQSPEADKPRKPRERELSRKIEPRENFPTEEEKLEAYGDAADGASAYGQRRRSGGAVESGE